MGEENILKKEKYSGKPSAKIEGFRCYFRDFKDKNYDFSE